ncbi:AMIN-like domain-containing (lipo)protein [Actinokineospora diospyrosa]|uniref:AMIN-like domain-containing protein n=1 Tax=Actinokineospora diospyrosa TaxID=103728 RepID=A0ABT1II64_9PSEU|nr:hypothetical protein [Actinokineospora diospyrosa]MCP2272350.1 hypothetical protein [Actinokineospora diospyrosa]
MKRVVSVIAAAVMALSIAVVAPAAATAAPYCGITWGSGTKTAGTHELGRLVNVRAGQQDCYDRLVIDLAGPGPHGFHVTYVDEIIQDPSGVLIPTRGAGKLQVSVFGASHEDDGTITYWPANPRELVNVAGWQTFRQVVAAGDFEGQSTIGLGVRARLPFRAFALPRDGGGTRIVVDVAHFW